MRLLKFNKLTKFINMEISVDSKHLLSGVRCKYNVVSNLTSLLETDN